LAADRRIEAKRPGPVLNEAEPEYTRPYVTAAKTPPTRNRRQNAAHAKPPLNCPRRQSAANTPLLFSRTNQQNQQKHLLTLLLVATCSVSPFKKA